MKGRSSNTLRIIGGSWRGRKIAFPDHIGLRPTGDRIRETLYNWLQPMIAGARCLDLFAGSGALGWEALSRGAAHVVMVEQDAKVCRYLRQTATELEASDRLTVVQGRAEDYLADNPSPFDLILLDPPFGHGLIAQCCSTLEMAGWLAPGAHLYLEHERDGELPTLPEGWKLHRSKTSGQVCYHLAIRH